MNTFHSIQSIRHTVLGLALTSLLTLSQAHAETVNCTAITSLPYVISTQGVYCFTGNLSAGMTFGKAIDIQTNNVTIDMNGFKLGNLSAGSGTNASGIWAHNRKNITIRNGTIRGFFAGVFLRDSTGVFSSGGHLVEDIRANGNKYYGLRVEGADNIVRRNHVISTGGSTYYANSFSYGIHTYGPNVRILNNNVEKTFAVGATAGAQGLRVTGAKGSVIANNHLSDFSAQPGGYFVGMFFSGTGIVRENNFVAEDGSTAISINGTATAICRDNIAVGFSGIMSQCTNGGGNVSTPIL